MFIGHFAVGFAGKRFAPRTSLGFLLAAPLLLDLLWPLFLLAGWESVRVDPGNTRFTPLDLHDYPYTHSLAGAVVWSLAFAALYFAFRRDFRVAALLALGVFSHWILDFLTHRPDMPLWPGSATTVGLGLWNSVAGTLAVEISMFVAGVWIYAAATRPKDRTGTLAFWGLVAFLAILYVAIAVGPPPPSPRAIAIGQLFSWLFVLWAVWLDRHRVPRAAAGA
ncbi:MAG: metal-dependent hydrolase [Myxococcales bacterium]